MSAVRPQRKYVFLKSTAGTVGVCLRIVIKYCAEFYLSPRSVNLLNRLLTTVQLLLDGVASILRSCEMLAAAQHAVCCATTYKFYRLPGRPVRANNVADAGSLAPPDNEKNCSKI